MRVRLGAFLLLKLSFAVRVSQHRYNYSGTRSALRQTEQGSTTVMATTIIAAIQMTSTHNKLSNLQTTIRLVECAAHRGASLIALPECSSFIGGGNQAEIIGGNHPKDAYTASETLEGPYAQALCQLASRLNVWLSVGGFPEIAKNDVQNYEKNGCGGDSQPLTTKVYNTHFMISPAGIITEKYRKIHLFDSPYAGLKESISTVAGDSIAVADCGFARVGLTTCYDLRFPELYGALCRPLRSKHIEMKDAEDISGYGLGADVVLVPSAFTVATGIAHWEVLLRARAIENQCYVVAAAQTGVHNDKRTSYGRSMIIDPWGKIISCCPSVESVDQRINETGDDFLYVADSGSICFANFDPEFLKETREKMPVRSHRRPDVYY